MTTPGPARPGVPAVSVCIPVYQGAALISRAVRSVLDQTFADFELVVRDNGCTDGTADVVASFEDPRIRLERADPTVTLAENWRLAVELARAPLVKIVCADDVLYPDCLAQQVAALGDDRFSLASGRVDMLDENGRVLVPGRGLRGLTGTRSSREVARRIVRHGGNPVGQPAAVTFRRAAYDAAGGFDGDKVFLMDIDLWARLLPHGALAGSRETVAGYRISAATVSGRAGRREFRAQRAFTAALAADPAWRVPRRDAVVGVLGAYAALARRHALVLATRLRNARPAPRRQSAGPARVPGSRADVLSPPRPPSGAAPDGRRASPPA
ncbi:glycosyltransferase involved in cell wall biosynthesis [Pseudonocardia sediminis]|uniref:Glycosyltransferase involved in cell wall biosynthesis n=1 Tax=Pseudonocardia sediminis TaxID=1397368 RepID=A0A4Q7UUR0_PSEST|nr:glycosyltransferase [Pseudonocardia sediminis]RZT85496.1 glycosyltransferase involved in cell wall biosynthesis [Pseudonocardia sediminis]